MLHFNMTYDIKSILYKREYGLLLFDSWAGLMYL